jgi:flagellar biosynthesis/type III secretory pathway protein FliH
MIYIKNVNVTQQIFIPRNELGDVNNTPVKGYEDGYKDGYAEGKEYQKDQLLNLYVTENGEYKREDGWGTVTVEMGDCPECEDCDNAYNDGYKDGYNQGLNDCPDCPEGEDCTGVYEEGYNDGHTQGKGEGYELGYNDGYNQGKAEGGDEVIYNTIQDVYDTNDDAVIEFAATVATYILDKQGVYDIVVTDDTGALFIANFPSAEFNLNVGDRCLFEGTVRRGNSSTYITNCSLKEVLSTNNYVVLPVDVVNITNEEEYANLVVYPTKYVCFNGKISQITFNDIRVEIGKYTLYVNGIIKQEWLDTFSVGDDVKLYGFTSSSRNITIPTDIIKITTQGGEEVSCNLEDKWITPSMDDRDDNGYVVVEESEGFDGLSRVVIDPTTIYNEGVEEGRNQGGGSGNCDDAYNQGVSDGYNNGYNDGYGNGYNDGQANCGESGGDGVECKIQNNKRIDLNGEREVYYPDEGFDGIYEIVVDAARISAEWREEGRNEVRNSLNSIEITENGRYSADEIVFLPFMNFGQDGNVWYDTHKTLTKSSDIEVRFAIINDNHDTQILIGGGNFKVLFGGGAIRAKVDDVELWNIPYNIASNDINIVQFNRDGFTVNSRITSWDWNDNSINIWEQITEGVTLYVGADNANGGEGVFKNGITSVKIDGVEYITNELLTFASDDGQLFTKMGDGTPYMQTIEVDVYGEGWKEINVNVQPKMRDYEGVKFGNSTFKECPFNIDDKEDYSYMFENCKSLENAPSINSFIYNAQSMFSGCVNLINGGNYNTGKATNLNGMYAGCNNLHYVCTLDCANLPNNVVGWNREAQVFDTNQYQYLTDFGGFNSLKQTVNLKGLIALNEQSVVNVFNGLYDFTGNGETPNSIQGKITMSAFLTDLVEQYRSIAENKGWTITIE